MRLLGRASLAAVVFAMFAVLPAFAQQVPPHDEFFWLGEINKATVVINTSEGLLDKSMAPRLAAGVAKVIADGDQPGAKRPRTVITFEPLLIKAAGEDITLLHAGRSSQDMHATYRSAILRDDLLNLADQLNTTTATIVRLSDKYKSVVVPNYTNGVAAQPNSYGHYLLGFAAGLDRDAQRIRETYKRVDRSSMGTTVLNGTSWPLDRERMAQYLGFNALVDNAYDASQISSVDEPVEAGAVVTSVALHTGAFIQDVMTQYAESRPWILLQEGGANTYVSSAMPQKRNPGLLIRTRSDASTAISQAEGVVMQAHNLPPGMSDPKDVKANNEMVESGIAALKGFDEVLNSLVIDPNRALEELNSDWTASQEVADVLMRKYKLPFRVGHHFASNVVEYARQKDIKPLDFPYADAQRIYRQTVEGTPYAGDFPMSEAEFRSTLDPVAIVNDRATVGGPQPSEMTRMLKDANARIAEQDKWIKSNRAHIASSLARLDNDFGKMIGH
ncbi:MULTISPECIES: argininosuccinate lyase [unclassified Caballeronia]|uniref:argininosuccinate lyase n=1 Tax=unclassified Caballeronia TaxID=2646786 RepID=UPI002855176D|nr:MULTISPECIES: argininosuccinate lyase [unclassified Caballeronia]MDR5773232.1 argininosuccinate lyase [Caballeronia sp. LZ002]MDR5848666.1 argininosuccinate lyase [Caballeronia sp. LZ003]